MQSDQSSAKRGADEINDDDETDFYLKKQRQDITDNRVHAIDQDTEELKDGDVLTTSKQKEVSGGIGGGGNSKGNSEIDMEESGEGIELLSTSAISELLIALKDAGPDVKNSIQARRILRRLIFYLNSANKPEWIKKERNVYLSLLERLSNNKLHLWNQAWFKVLSEINIQIPKPMINGYDRDIRFEGLGSEIKKLVENGDINLSSKNILLQGWMTTCEMMSMGGNLNLSGGVSVNTTEVNGILENIRTSTPMSITPKQILDLDSKIKWSEEITQFPFLKLYSLYILNKAYDEKMSRLEQFIEIFSSDAPDVIFSRIQSGRMDILRSLRSIYAANAEQDKGNVIPLMCSSTMRETKCNAGCIKMLCDFETMGVVDGGEVVLIGNIFKNIESKRKNPAFNQSTIQDLLSTLYSKMHLSIKEKETRMRRTRDGFDFLRGKNLIQGHFMNGMAGVTARTTSDFCEGCILLNFCRRELNWKREDVPKICFEYLGDDLSENTPVINPNINRHFSETKGIFDEYFELSNKNIVKLGPSAFMVDPTGAYVGMNEDLAVYDRYNDKNLHVIVDPLSRGILFDLLNNIGQEGACAVIAGAMACMIRFRRELADYVSWKNTCKDFIHGFSPSLSPAIQKRYNRGNLANPVDKVDIRRTLRTAAYARLVNTENFYSGIFGRDVNFQQGITDAFIKLRSGNGQEAFKDICNCDPLFAENIAIFGLAVFFRRFIENKRDNKDNDPVYTQMILNPQWARIGRAIIGGVFDGRKLQLYWDILSVAIHGWDTEERRFVNRSNMTRRLPFIKWEILNLFFRLTADASQGWMRDVPENIEASGDEIAGRIVPFLSRLRSVDALLNRVCRLNLHS